MKKLALVLVLVLAFALPVFANPFVDVPLNHWAYDSVQSLSAKGIIVGYPDGTFGGGKSLTRYEFAEATAKEQQLKHWPMLKVWTLLPLMM